MIVGPLAHTCHIGRSRVRSGGLGCDFDRVTAGSGLVGSGRAAAQRGAASPSVDRGIPHLRLWGGRTLPCHAGLKGQGVLTTGEGVCHGMGRRRGQAAAGLARTNAEG